MKWQKQPQKDAFPFIIDLNDLSEIDLNLPWFYAGIHL
jgi:hypothetical protein